MLMRILSLGNRYLTMAWRLVGRILVPLSTQVVGSPDGIDYLCGAANLS